MVQGDRCRSLLSITLVRLLPSCPDVERRQAEPPEIRALNEQMIKAQEAERMRIAGDLHDGVLQQITSLTLRLGKVKRQVPPIRKRKQRSMVCSKN